MRFDIGIPIKKIMNNSTIIWNLGDQAHTPLLRCVSGQVPTQAFLFCLSKMKSLIWTGEAMGLGAFLRCERASVRRNSPGSAGKLFLQIQMNRCLQGTNPVPNHGPDRTKPTKKAIRS
jgi:hypothetical protein